MPECVVVILMGSKADLGHAEAVASALAGFGVATEMRVGSAHKTPTHVLEMLRNYEADARPKVYVTIAGRSNALSGFVDANVAAPVIACPPYSDRYAGADVLSSLRMPSGVAAATVLEPEAAALLAVKYLALHDPHLRARLIEYQEALRARLVRDDRELAARGSMTSDESR